jgi:hypothetical protein
MAERIKFLGKCLRHNARAFLVVSLLALASGAHGEVLRGFGKVEMLALPEATDGMRLSCESPERALVLMHKLGQDLSQSATVPVTWQQVRLGNKTVPVLVRQGLGSFLPCVKGNIVTVFTAPADQAPQAAFADLASRLEGARFFDPNFRYPAYLDKYSRYGIGAWYPSNWHDKIIGDKPNDVDDHFKFAREMDLVLQTNAAGFLLRNLMPKLREYDRPYHFIRWQEWSPQLAMMAPEELTTAGNQFTPMPHYYGQISDGGHRLMGWNNWQQQERMRKFVDDPMLMDWPDPNGEVGPSNEDYYWDFSENNRLNFVRFLRDVRGYSLEKLGMAWYGDAKHFASWADVPIPLNYEFFGWTPGSLQAEPTWRLHPANPKTALQDGLKAGYQLADFPDENWVQLPIPGGELGTIFGRAKKRIWHRGQIEVPEKWLKAKQGGRIYLTAVTFTTAGGPRKPDRVWVNGRELAAWSAAGGSSLVGQFDVTNMLKPGKNTIAYLPAFDNSRAGRGTLRGTFFLTDTPREAYPFSDTHLNARFVDWREYVPWAIADMLEDTFKAIRGVDPDRFIKMHAYRHKDLSIPLAARYGCFGHNTGDEAFFRPWDRRFGYVRGIPASCEPSGSVNTPDHFKRWLGWHCFTGGPNALDYFHNIQSMMYSPCADLWKEYMPYWKLGPRRVLKKPDIALFWSSRNNGLLPKSLAFNLDLGRGDLLSLGYSYVYVDESTFRDGLVDDYPVVWDTGTAVMDLDTIARVRNYVENGGTYVMLQDTARHTSLQGDAWPAEALTGFRVREVRPMTGTLAIMNEQPLFTRLAGKVFDNRGVSIDYSNYNFADKCLALEPVADGTTVLARYDDGAIAMGMRSLGKGRVVVLGSPFWRDSYDEAGVWWPGEKQNEFLEDILAGLGLKPLATADTHKVWREHYLATNGTEEFFFLHNPSKDPVTFSTEWTTLKPAGKLYDPKNGRQINGEVNGCSVKLSNLSLAPRETLIIATQPRKTPQEALADWSRDLFKFWRQSEPGVILERPALPLYELRLADKLFGKVLTPTEAEALPTPPQGTQLGACQSPEAFEDHPDPERRCVFHVSFTTPAEWNAQDSVKVYIRGERHVAGRVDAWLNGTRIMTQAKTRARGYSALSGGAEAEISKLLKRDSDNVLVFTTGSDGFEGEVDVQMRPKPTEQVQVAGTWQVQRNADSGLTQTSLPGKMNGLYAFTDIEVPAGWQGDRIFADLDLEGSYTAFAINGKVIFHPITWYAPVSYMDITPWVKCGQTNRLTIITLSAAKSWQPGELQVNSVSLQRVKPRLFSKHQDN